MPLVSPRRLQFTLRTLLALVALTAILLSLWPRLRAAWEEHQYIRHLKALVASDGVILHPSGQAMIGCWDELPDLEKRPRAVAALTSVVKDTNADPRMRCLAAFTLAHMGPDARTAVPSILEIVKDDTEDKHVARSARVALGMIDKEAFRKLEDSGLENGSRNR